MYSSDLKCDLQSGTTLAQVASKSGVSSSDLLASVENDLKADAPSSAPALSSDQLAQMATNIINGAPPSSPGSSSSSSTTARTNLSALASSTGLSASAPLQQLTSGEDLSDVLGSRGSRGYGSGVADSVNGGVAVDEYA